MLFVSRIILVLFIVVIPTIGMGQVKDDYIPKTIIFKVKEDYRKYCGENEITNSDFISIANQIELNSLQKVFPKKTKRDK